MTGGAGPTGIMHCHSVYSDGEYTLRELREVFLREGLTFACVTDHADFFDAESLRAYVNECNSLSDGQFRMVAGLEYSCDNRMHVLGYGVTTLVDTTDPQAVIRHIDAAGGVSVIAHPADSMFDWIETFAILPAGLEVWNSKYDGPRAPRPGTFRLFERLRRRKPGMLAFYGTDLHWKHQFRGLVTRVGPDASTRTEILRSLSRGDYVGVVPAGDLPSNGKVGDELMGEFQRINARFQRRQNVVKRIKRLFAGVGKRLPASVKSQLRRLLS